MLLELLVFVFDYHIELHYSQTTDAIMALADMFDYHIELHYSQTQE